LNPREVIRKALEENRNKLLEHEAYALASYYNIPVPKAGLAKTPEEAGELADKIGYPIVLKIVSPDIVHKSDVGGVILNLNSKKEVVEATSRIFSNVAKNAPKARIAGVLVQHMIPSGLEVIIGGVRDNIFGSVVMFGIGGVFVEVLKDVSFRISPISLDDAFEMMKEIKSSNVLEGYRGQQPVDKKALAEMIVNVSRLLEENIEIDSIDLNPVMAYPNGACVADARVVIKTR